MPSTPSSSSEDDSKALSNKHPDRSAKDDEKTPLKYSDRHFIERTMKMNTEEVNVSQIVAQSGATPQVREFASEMVMAHQKVASELGSLASKKNIEVPSKEEDTKKWAQKKQSDLDEDYVKHMISAHKTLIDLFEKAAKSNDADVASFASKYLPDLRTHYTEAETLKSQVK